MQLSEMRKGNLKIILEELFTPQTAALHWTLVALRNTEKGGPVSIGIVDVDR